MVALEWKKKHQAMSWDKAALLKSRPDINGKVTYLLKELAFSNRLCLTGTLKKVKMKTLKYFDFKKHRWFLRNRILIVNN